MKSGYIDAEWLVAQVKLCQQSGPRIRRRALDDLLEALWPRVLQIAIRQQRRSWGASSSWTLAEDAAIHACMVLVEKIDLVYEPAGLFKWINRIVWIYLLSEWRGRAKELLTDEPWPFDSLRHYNSTELLSVVGRLRIELIGLPYRDRWLIYMRYWEEKSPQELSALEGVTRQTINVRLTRIHRQLREKLLTAGYNSIGWADTSTD